MFMRRIILTLAAIAFALTALVGGIARPADDERVVSFVEISATDEPPPAMIGAETIGDASDSHGADGGESPTLVARLRRRVFMRGAFFSRFISMHSAGASSYYVDSWAAFLIAIG